MNSTDASYTVGRGRPPLHTRFRKGQSGNPSGKPGPAALARRHFRRSLFTALAAETEDLKEARPRGYLDALVQQITLDALGGRMQALKLILSELDKEIARSNPTEAGYAEQESSDARAAVETEQAGDAGDPPPLEDYARWLKANRGE